MVFVGAMLLAGCAAHRPASALTAADMGAEPSEAMVRRDLRCPSGEIVYTGGLGGGGTHVVVRDVEACGRRATYVWRDSQWTRKT